MTCRSNTHTHMQIEKFDCNYQRQEQLLCTYVSHTQCEMEEIGIGCKRVRAKANRQCERERVKRYKEKHLIYKWFATLKRLSVCSCKSMKTILQLLPFAYRQSLSSSSLLLLLLFSFPCDFPISKKMRTLTQFSRSFDDSMIINHIDSVIKITFKVNEFLFCIESKIYTSFESQRIWRSMEAK